MILIMATNVCVRISDIQIVSVWFFPVTLSSTNPDVTFRGFIIQALTSENNIIGSFIIVDEETRLLECQLSGEDPISLAVSVSR